MTAEILRRAAARIRHDVEFGQAHGDDDFLLDVADLLEGEVLNAAYRERQAERSNADRLRAEPFPVYYDGSTLRAIAVATTYLGGDA